MTAINRRQSPAPRNWKKWLEEHPVTVFAVAILTACSTTYTVLSHLTLEEKRITDQAHSFQLDQMRADFNVRLRDLERRLTCIDRRVGTNDALMDINSLLITPRQIPALGQEFTFFEDLHCYVSIPKGEGWSSQKTTEADLLKMMFEGKVSEELKNTGLLEFSKQFPIWLWKSTNTFRVPTGDEDLGTLTIFPFVCAQCLDNKKFFASLGKFAQENEIDDRERTQELIHTLDSMQLGTTNSPTQYSNSVLGVAISNSDDRLRRAERGSQQEAETRFELEQDLARAFNSDMAGLLLGIQIMAGFNMSSVVDGASFRVINAEKNGNIFYMHWQIVFSPTERRPKIYWDKEMICICNSETTFVVTTSAPSIDQRPGEGAWMMSWIAGLRIPVE